MAKVSYPHYAWAVGHALVLLGTIHTFLGFITFSFRSKSYYLAYAGAIVSWGIVVYKSLGAPQPSRAYVQRALLDENVQYLLLALYWFLTKPIALTLLPFATFSLFHTLTFLRTSVLPKVPATPNGKNSGASAAPQPPTSAGARLSKAIQTWVKANYETAMLFVAYIEVGLVFGRILLGAITFQNSLLTPLIFGHFLRLRYYLSPPTRTAFGWLNSQVEHYVVKNQSCPAIAKKGVVTIRELIIRYSESIIQVQQPGAAGAGPAQQRRAQ
ncbi:uncharacterized protein JCM15063_000161 [Sporobolomyces koalae]|uniref:uncharacterized protein n=1 Tax=Sporobolomyces koalae TaxID=500713 RepID=UPI003172481F